MKVSQKTEYGLRAMLALAENFKPDKLVSIKELAQKEKMPETFLEQIMLDLKKAGLIKSKRGAAGGYRLKQAPEKISVSQVITALEGSLSPARCRSSCEHLAGCSTRTVLDLIEQSITSTLDKLYLNDLVKVGDKHD